ncbi:MAG: endonuclease domain-containing protein [Chloroflexi bacterium]|nr:endonuclease domain-containing protein [Chloroflexota bacterium]
MTRKLRGKTTSQAVYTAREQRRTPTRAEEILWNALRRRRLGGLKFRRQHPFEPYILDMFCVEHQLEIEAAGEIHRDLSQKEHDEIRAAYLEANGIRVLRFSNQMIENNLAQVLEHIRRATHSPSPLATSLRTWLEERGLGGEV